jgi:thrombospondin type 3 repeat protein
VILSPPSAHPGARGKQRRLTTLAAVTLLSTALLCLPAPSAARSRDRDHDGLSDRAERRLHTSPRRRDTDGDRLRDGYEVRRSHTNPRRRDTDGDRLRDGYEVRRSHTNPRRRDTDGDGLSDGYEVRRSHTDPRRADTDGDGHSDGLERLFGWDPHNPSSPPRPRPHPLPRPLPPPQPPPAATVYLSPSGSDAAACSKGAPCRSLARGYQVADPGQTVELAGGTYADTSLPLDSDKTSTADVLFRPAAGKSVTLSAPLHVAARHLELRGMRFAQTLNVDAAAQDVTLRDDTLKNFVVLSSGAQAPRDISFLGGSIGPSVDSNNIIGSSGTSTTASPQNVVLDGVDIHDFTRSSGSSAHVECLQVWAASGLTIRNSKLRNCEVFDVFLQKLPGGAAATPSNILIENNFLDCCRSGFFSIRLADHAGTSWSNVTIRNNSTNKAIDPDPGVPYSNVKVASNIGPKLEFYEGASDSVKPRPAGVSADYNVWYSGTALGAHDRVAPSGYRDAAGLDFHLSPGAAAIDHGDPSGSASTDIDGETRPAGAAPDAGADETSGASIFLSATGSDSNGCTQPAPCRTFNRGYQRAQPGQVVEVAGGTYGDQSIAHDGSKTSSDDVVFRPASGAAVTVGDVLTYGSHLTVKGMRARDLTARVPDPPNGVRVDDVTFRDMDARNFMIYSATNVNVLGGDYGPASDCGGPYGGSNNSIRQYPGAAQPANILIEGVKIHDIVSYDLGPCHMEGLAVFAGRNVTVRDSKFWGNSVYDVFMQPNSGAVSDITLENNWFAAPVGQAGQGSGQSTVAFSGSSADFTNTLIRHNSFNGVISPDDNGANPNYSNFRVVGNVGQLPWNGCSLRVAYSYNVWKGSACAGTDVGLGGGALPFTNTLNGSGLDYHLTGGAAVDRVPSGASSTADDIDGQARPLGAGRDAGADELR